MSKDRLNAIVQALKPTYKSSKQWISSIIINMVCGVVVRLHKQSSHKRKYNFSICAIFKNESMYLKEWIEYHKIVGVSHIYLYNNFSNDDYESVLHGYVNDGYVTLKDWPFMYGQIGAYTDAYDSYKDETQWLMFLDIDEYICPKFENDINVWIDKYKKYPSIVLYWLMFGTNGIIEENSSSRLVIEKYTHSWANIRNVGKIVLNTDYIPVKIYHHHIFCRIKLFGINFVIPMINENKKFIGYPGTEKCPNPSSIQINHYWSKSLSEYVLKISKGEVYSKKNHEIRQSLDFFRWHELQNISVNKVIWRFLIQLKIRINQIDFRIDKD